MPELPEVEVVKKSLTKTIVNLTIKNIIFNTNKLRYIIDKKKLKKIINKKVLSVKRRSKYLLINFDKNITIIVHLGMTGKFLVSKNNHKRKTSFYYEIEGNERKHNHIIFEFNKKTKLIYNDVRKFGFIEAKSTNKIINTLYLKKLGPEPLSNKFNLIYFRKYIRKRKKILKSLLMDQTFVSGLGNIYVNEVLYMTNLHPKKDINKINDAEIRNLINSIKKILKKSIREGGSSIKNFNDTRGKSGSYQQNFYVYAREGKKCHQNNCSDIIRRIVISNRSTFYCKSCQK